MVGSLVWQDVKHNLRPIRALPLLLLAVFLAYDDVKFTNKLGTEQDWYYFAEGALTREHYWLFAIIPLFAGLMGGSLAAERRVGVTMSILSRGVPRYQYLRAKLLGAALSSAILTLLAILGFWAIVFATWIPGRAPDLEPQAIKGPVKSLFIYSPFLHDLLVAGMEITAAASLSVIGVLAGLILANEYVAMVAAPIVFILVKVVTTSDLWFLNFEEYVYLGYDFYWGPHFRWLIPFAPFLYWGTFAFIITVICQRIFAKKEIA